MLNKVQLIGRIGKDPDIKQFDSGVKVAKLPLATSEKYKDKEGEKKEITEWHNIEAWGKLAGIIESYVNKGDLLYIEGKIRTNKYQDKEGNNKFFVNIRADQMQMLSSKNSSANKQTDNKETKAKDPATGKEVNFGQSNDENANDLPF